jgi:NitT/TauT family transport system substrate-binding protein
MMGQDSIRQIPIWRGVIGAIAICASLTALPGPAVAQDVPKIVIGIPGVPPIFISTIAYVAQEEGFFKKYGANVELRQFDNGTAAARAVVAGDLDVSMSSTALVISQIANAGVNLVGIYGFPRPDYTLATTDPKRAACEDLRGQQISVDTPGGARSLALKDMLMSGCKLKLEDVQQVAMGSNTAPAMISGQLVFGVLHLDDIPDIESHGKSVTIIKSLPQTNPDNHNLLVTVRRDKLAEKREGYVRMLAGIVQAAHFMADPSNADRVADIIAPVTGRDKAIVKGALKRYLDFGLWAINDDGMDRKRLATFIAEQLTSGNIKPGKTPPTVDQLIDPSVWRDADAMVTSVH